MGRTLVIGDIHGGFKALLQVLEKANVTTQDTLVFLGDYVDGWSETPQLINYVLALKETHNCVFIRGNHDALCLEWLKDDVFNPMWLEHGGRATMEAYAEVSNAEKEKHIYFFEELLQNYYLDSENRLFVHAGFTNLHGVTHEYFSKMLYWDRTLWETALAINTNLKPGDISYPKRLLQYKEIFIGHTPVTRINKTIPVQAANVWNIDTGAAFKGPLTILDVTTKQYWQSQPVFELYPNEKGRN
jgi:serine/threonine protein phosphatase 1